MNEKDLFRAVGDVSDDLITEASGAVRKVRRIRVRKIIALAAAFVMFAGITVWAANIVLSGRSGHSSAIPDYYSVPSAERLMQDIGIALNIPEEFSNGFRFAGGHIVKNEDYGENGGVFERYQSINCDYKKNGERISLYADAAKAGNQMEDDETAEVYCGSEIKYFTYMNKFVPADYELTEQDQEDKKSGKYVFSYGTDEIEISHVQILGWEYHGLNYQLCAMDSSLGRDKLVAMAKEIIDAQNGGAK